MIESLFEDDVTKVERRDSTLIKFGVFRYYWSFDKTKKYPECVYCHNTLDDAIERALELQKEKYDFNTGDRISAIMKLTAMKSNRIL